MADRATVATVDPLTVVVDGPAIPALLLAGALYVPVFGDVVTSLPLSDGSVLVLGRWAA